ncbi:P-loop containing nucleoside triphosphate hydrolase protein, partial [Ochromonadaceae sp. CCMP2298]
SNGGSGGGGGGGGLVYLCLTTYEVAMKDETLLRTLSQGGTHRWAYLVVDEAQRLKNRSSLLFQVLNRIHSPRKSPPMGIGLGGGLGGGLGDALGQRLLLTGTPLQNSLGELWALLYFILPGVFSDEQQFSDWFNRPFESDSEGEGEE